MKKLSPGFRCFLHLLAVCVVAGVALSLAGCANGVVMTDEEAVACRTEGCAALTEREFLRFMGRAFKDGYEQGWRDFGRQSGRTL